jgi:hypothetical protein
MSVFALSRVGCAQLPSHVRTQDWARPFHICTGIGLTSATLTPGLGSPVPHLHRDSTQAVGVLMSAEEGPIEAHWGDARELKSARLEVRPAVPIRNARLRANSGGESKARCRSWRRNVT